MITSLRYAITRDRLVTFFVTSKVKTENMQITFFLPTKIDAFAG